MCWEGHQAQRRFTPLDAPAGKLMQDGRAACMRADGRQWRLHSANLEHLPAHAVLLAQAHLQLAMALSHMLLTVPPHMRMRSGKLPCCTAIGAGTAMQAT